MIEINLLPGAGKKARGRSPSLNVAAVMSGAMSQVRDVWLLGAVACVIVAIAGVGGMWFHQHRTELTLADKLEKAEQDSVRYNAVIREKHKAEARRDSVVRQVQLIRTIDNKRFVWSHLMDEVSRALPPYTWVNSVVQTNQTGASLALVAEPGQSKLKRDAAQAQAIADFNRVSFRIIGNTVDIQALTRFMKLLEASPFIENVSLVKSSLVMIEGKEVTEFQLDATYQIPDPSAIRTVPVSLSVR